MVAIKLEKEDLVWAWKEGLISKEAVDILWNKLFDKCEKILNEAEKLQQQIQQKVHQQPLGSFKREEVKWDTYLCVGENGIDIARYFFQKKKKIFNFIFYFLFINYFLIKIGKLKNI